MKKSIKEVKDKKNTRGDDVLGDVPKVFGENCLINDNADQQYIRK